MYLVKLHTASGREIEVLASGRNDDAACKDAVNTMEREEPGQGWQAVWALEMP